MKIYTRTGDTGDTGLFGGGRVSKDHPRVHACGIMDELNASVGRALGAVEVGASHELLSLIQHDLFALGAHLASPLPPPGRSRPALPPLPDHRIAQMEARMDSAEEALPPLKAFILPGGGPGARDLHVCRTVCRRVERAVVRLAEEMEGTDDPGVQIAIRYLNRLSDLLFVLARLENAEAGIADVEWSKEP